MADIAYVEQEINEEIESIKVYNETSANEKQLKKNKGNSFSKSVDKFSSGLNDISNKQKRFQKNVPTSYDKLLNLIGQTSSNGSETLKYLRKKLFEALTKLEPEVQKVISENALKTLGCSNEQTYPGFDLSSQQLQYLSTFDLTTGIYIPVSDIDFNGNLKLNPQSDLGVGYYEVFEPSVSSDFINYGNGKRKFPVNKMLNLRMTQNNVNLTFSTEFNGKFYNGESKNKLFDIQYTNHDEFNVSGDFFRIFLMNRTSNNTGAAGTINFSGTNQVKKFVQDYYKTIKIIDFNSVMASLMNYATGYSDISASIGFEKLEKDSKFALLIQRILGLCFDSREEIDISGISKIPELDGVDESFFEFTEIDLKNIQQRITNIQMGVVEFEDCGNVKLPVNVTSIQNDITNFSNLLSGLTPDLIVKNMEKIVDNLAQTPEWKLTLPQVDFNVVVNENILSNLPKAVAYSILSPKVLLPIFTLLKVTESSAYNTANQAIISANTQLQSGNTQLQSGNTIGQNVFNSVSDGVDFIKKFKSFVISTISVINEKFLEVLYDILKRDIFNLLKTILSDLSNSRNKKRMSIILRLTEFAMILVEGRKDYRKCKSLFDSILKLLKLVNDISGTKNRIPNALLSFVKYLPGSTPEGATKEAIKLLQRLGLPTGALPGGKPNLMNQLILQINKGLDQERNQNEKIQVTIDPEIPGLFWGKAL